MKIENLLLNNIILNYKSEFLKEGSIFTAKIIELLDQDVILDIKGYGTIQTSLEANIDLVLGEEISFLVKSSNDNKIQLKPLINDDIQFNNHKVNTSISKVLYSFNIKETKLSIGLVENLMKHNVPINEQNLIEGIKNLEKLIQLNDITDEERVILVDPSIKDGVEIEYKESFVNDIDEKVLIIENDNKKDIPSIDKIDKEDISSIDKIDKEDVKQLLVVNKNDFLDKKDFSIVIKELLGNEDTLNIEDEYIKLVSFFIKHNIKPSLNNIKNIRDLNNNPIEFAEDFKEIISLIDKLQDGKASKILFNKEFDISGKDSVSNRESKLYDLQKLIQNFDQKDNLQQKEGLKNIENKIEFLRDLNKDLSFLFLPIHYGKEGLDGILTMLKDKRNKKIVNDKINVFISVNTNNLGNIKISCQLKGNSINIKMNIKDEDLELFKSKEEHLIEKILSIGYILNKVEYTTKGDLQIIDSMVSNPSPTYILDLKV